MKPAALCAIGCLVAAPAFAESWTVNAVGQADDMSTMHQVAEGHMIMQTHSVYTAMVDADPSNPLHGATGPCFGAMEIKPPEIAGDGRCVYTSADGDMISIGWQVTGMTESGGSTGTWTLMGGSGRFEGSSGGGEFEVTNDMEAKTETNKVSGEITLP
ncbi:hypothetical protein ACW9UR_22240 [Halovulum sp. GXIMD14794]